MFFHGLAAYRGTREPLQQVRAADQCLDVEVCGATRPIGPIGLVVIGQVKAVFREDSWSYVRADGTRVPGEDWHWDYEAGTAGVDLDDIDAVMAWCRTQHDWHHGSDGRGYCEAFVAVKAIVGVWVKPYANAKTRKAARIIARRHGCRVMTVGGTDRIWDVYDIGADDHYWELAAEHGYTEYA